MGCCEHGEGGWGAVLNQGSDDKIDSGFIKKNMWIKEILEASLHMGAFVNQESTFSVRTSHVSHPETEGLGRKLIKAMLRQKPTGNELNGPSTRKGRFFSWWKGKFGSFHLLPPLAKFFCLR